jgi:hypothetical protein
LDWAKAATEAIKMHESIKLPKIFFMSFLLTSR